MMRITALIMAGGHGERFWPMSRTKLPKQFLALTDPVKTMLQLTVERIAPLVAIENVYIATSEAYKEIVEEQLPNLPRSNILCEPIGRSTAPCIGLGAVHVLKKYGDDTLMAVLPSDHLIQDSDSYLDVLKRACDFAQYGSKLITIGIQPDRPETGYGYIQYQKNDHGDQPYSVERFVEKPDSETAKKYLASGNFLWNSGMFIWKASTLLENIRQFLPDMYAGLVRIQASIDTQDEAAVLDMIYRGFQTISIDYGIMEKADCIWVFPGDFGWDDVGSWQAIYRLAQKDAEENALQGNVITANTRHSLIRGSKKMIAVVGLEDLIVIDTEDVLLICNGKNTEEIKTVLEKLREKGNMTPL